MKTSRKFRFRLYVAAGAQNSVHALANLMELCNEHLLGRFEIEVVDVFRQPKRALADGVLMTPTLLKLEPNPVLRIIGSLSQRQVVVRAIGLESLAA